MADVRFEQVSKIYPGNEEPAVDALDLHITDGELMVLVGPSGSGKTTALRMLAGLEEPDAGAIYIGERDVTYVQPKKRDVSMVFQNYALYPYMTVAQNIGFPLKIAKVDKKGRETRVREVAAMLGLSPLLERRPGQLSGGERQRVAMGRAIVRVPSVFLMDEPLSNLDAKLRVQMRADVAALQADFAVTTVYVTHDQAEAMTLGHRVAVLRDGRLQQCGTPARALRPAGQHVRRRLHRLAGDEPLRRAAGLERLDLARRHRGRDRRGAVESGAVERTERARPRPAAGGARARKRGAARAGRGRRGARRGRLRLLLDGAAATKASGSSPEPRRAQSRPAESGSRCARGPNEAHLFDRETGERLEAS